LVTSEPIALQNIMDTQYVGKVDFGYPSQSIDIMFDTGSSWTWVYTLEGCEENGNQCPSVEKYSVDLSQTETVSDDYQDD